MRLPIAAAVLAVLAVPASPRAAGEPVNGFPSWEERVLFEWTNRARCDPQFEMAACGASCGEAACYAPAQPLLWADGRAARFHAVQLSQASPVTAGHASPCTLVAEIGALYPDTCGGEASCACVGGTFACSEVCTPLPFEVCSPTCTSYEARFRLFRGTFASTNGEVVASGSSDPDEAFYSWLYQPSASPACGASSVNADRVTILENAGASVGTGMSGTLAVMDFTRPQVVPVVNTIVSGAHYPRQGPSVEAWANWWGWNAAVAAVVDVDGTCTSMTLERGSDTNGAWRVALSGLGSGCHRYYFAFKDSDGTIVEYPSTGSYGIGDASCVDFSTDRPGLGSGCGPVLACEPGPGGCDDGDPCTADACDPAVGCSHTVLANGAPCSDGDACNGLERCQAGACIPGTPPVCDDGDACTADACDPATGCTATPVSCDDGNPCTVDSCDVSSGCAHAGAPAATECSDGLACNGVEHCDGAGGCTPGATCQDPGSSSPSHTASGCGTGAQSGGSGLAVALVGLALLARPRIRRQTR